MTNEQPLLQRIRGYEHGICYYGDVLECWEQLSFCLYFHRQDRDIEPEDFQRYTENVKTSLQECPVQRPPAALLSRQREHTSGGRQSQSHKVMWLIWYDFMEDFLSAIIWTILTSNKYSHRLAGSPASLWGWWNSRVMTRSHQRWTQSPATSPQVPEPPAKPSTTAALPTAGSTTQNSQTPFLRGNVTRRTLYK